MGLASDFLGNSSPSKVGSNQIAGAQSALKGGDLSTGQQFALARPTFGASFLYNPIKKLFGHGRNYYDGDNRRKLAEALAQQYGGGSDFSFNTVGGPKSINAEAFRRDPTSYNVDLNRENANLAISLINPLSFAMNGSNRTLAQQFAGHLANQIYDDNPQNIIKNALSVYEKLGVTPDEVHTALDGLATNGKITADEQNIFKSTIDQLRQGGKVTIPGAATSSATPSPVAQTLNQTAAIRGFTPIVANRQTQTTNRGV